MSKKKKNKKKSRYYYSTDGGYCKSSKKGTKKGGKKSAYKSPKCNTVKPTLDKGEIKANKKAIKTPVEVPKEFRKNRLKCNHAGSTMSVEEFKNMTPTYAAYTPALEAIINHYGAEHVHICADCYDVVVDRSEVTSDDVRDALAVLYAACNVAVSNKRMKNDEVKTIGKLKEVMDRFDPVVETLEKIEAKGDCQPSGTSGSVDTSSLNANQGRAFMA